MTSSRILKAVWSIFDKKDRGSTINEINEVQQYYSNALKKHPRLKKQDHAGNIFAVICDELKKKDYFKKEENHNK